MTSLERLPERTLTRTKFSGCPLTLLPFQEKYLAITRGNFMRILFTAILLVASFAQAQKLKEGDLLFMQSQGSLTPAIKEATGSDWTHVGLLLKFEGEWIVLEASDGVEITPLVNFVYRYNKGSVLVKRLKSSVRKITKKHIAQMKEIAAAIVGAPYDFFFEWSDRAYYCSEVTYYCSEVTYKIFEKVLGYKLGQIQKFKDLKIDGPEVKKLIEAKERAGGKIDVEESIITPVAEFNSPVLELVKVYRE
jgi:hypothetical protein